MFRLAIILYLNAVTAVGPGICYCSAERDTRHLPSNSPSKHCCSEATSEHGDTPCPAPKAPCRCQERFTPANVAQAEDYCSFDLTLRSQYVTCFAASVVDPNSLYLTAPISPLLHLSFLFLDGKDILRAYHILRC